MPKLTRRGLAAVALLTTGLASGAGSDHRRNQNVGAAFPAVGERRWKAQVPQLRVGLLGGENGAERLGRYDAYRLRLEDTIKVPTRLLPAFGLCRRAASARREAGRARQPGRVGLRRCLARQQRRRGAAAGCRRG